MKGGKITFIISCIVSAVIGFLICNFSIANINQKSERDENKTNRNNTAALFPKYFGNPIDTPRARVLINTFRSKIRNLFPRLDSAIPYAVCYTSNELRVYLDSIDSGMRNVDTSQRGIAFYIGMYGDADANANYRKGKATILMSPARFVKNATNDGKIDTLDSRFIQNVYTASTAINTSATGKTEVYDVGHIYP